MTISSDTTGSVYNELIVKEITPNESLSTV